MQPILKCNAGIGDAEWGQVRALAFCKLPVAQIARLCDCSRWAVHYSLSQDIRPSQRVRRLQTPRTAQLRHRRRRVAVLIAKKKTIWATKEAKARGRPRKDGTPRATYLVKRRVVKLSFASPRQVARQLTIETGKSVSASTVRRDLLAQQVKCYVRPKRQRVDEADAGKRLLFCRKVLRMSNAKLSLMVFSDEKWFDSNDAGFRYQWSKKDDKGNLIPRETEQAPPKVFVWGAIWVGGRHLSVVTLDGCMNSEQYRKQCLEPLCKKLGGKGFVLMQDGARVHWTQEVKDLLSKKKLPYLENWPPHSCDLNPIESLWAILQVRVCERGPWSSDELARYVVEEFHKVDQSIIDNLCLSFRPRCEKCVEANGRSIGK